MIKRPLGVTVVCWILIIVAVLSVVGSIFILVNPDKIAAIQAQSDLSRSLLHFYLAFSIINPVINFIVAVFMLHKSNWARHVYLIFNAIVYISALIVGPNKLTMIIVIIIFLVFLYFLYNRPATEYFTGVKIESLSDEDIQ